MPIRKCIKNRWKKFLMIRVNGHITLSSKLKSTLNERKLKQNTHLKQDLCSGFSRKFLLFWEILKRQNFFKYGTEVVRLKIWFSQDYSTDGMSENQLQFLQHLRELGLVFQRKVYRNTSLNVHTIKTSQ